MQRFREMKMTSKTLSQPSKNAFARLVVFEDEMTLAMITADRSIIIKTDEVTMTTDRRTTTFHVKTTINKAMLKAIHVRQFIMKVTSGTQKSRHISLALTRISKIPRNQPSIRSRTATTVMRAVTTEGVDVKVIVVIILVIVRTTLVEATIKVNLAQATKTRFHIAATIIHLSHQQQLNPNSKPLTGPKLTRKPMLLVSLDGQSVPFWSKIFTWSILK